MHSVTSGVNPVWGALYYWQVDEDGLLATFLIGFLPIASIFGIISFNS